MGNMVLHVRVPHGNGYSSPRHLRYLDDHITMYGASFVRPGDVITSDEDGVYRIHVHKPGMVEFIKQVLVSHYGLVIVKREQSKVHSSA